MTIIYHNCMLCAHFAGDIDDPSCRAFPKGIPVAIWNDERTHIKPIEGDNGFQYEDNPSFLRKKEKT